MCLVFWDKENVMLFERTKVRDSDLKELSWRCLGSGLEGTSEVTWPARGKRRGKSSQEQAHPRKASLNASISKELLWEHFRARA